MDVHPHGQYSVHLLPEDIQSQWPVQMDNKVVSTGIVVGSLKIIRNVS